jgi:hypothetical protein
MGTASQRLPSEAEVWGKSKAYRRSRKFCVSPCKSSNSKRYELIGNDRADAE